MRNLAERPGSLKESREFSRSLPWRARGPAPTVEWRGLAWLVLGLAGISGCAWSPSFERSPVGGSASPHSLTQPAAVETGRSGLPTYATRSFPRPSFSTHIKRPRPSRRRPETARMVAEGIGKHIFRPSAPRHATVRAGTVNLAFQEFHGLHHTERAGLTSSWSAAGTIPGTWKEEQCRTESLPRT